MWCSTCRQDVPGVLAPARGQLCCPRCGDGLREPLNLPQCGDQATEGEAEKAHGGSSTAPEAIPYDAWEMEERLRHLERIYVRSPAPDPWELSKPPVHLRLDQAHSGGNQGGPSWGKRSKKNRLVWLSRIGQLAVTFGLAASACGGCLVVWAYFGARADLWAVGLPIAIAGQLTLLAGLAFTSAGSSEAAKPSDARLPGTWRAREGNREVRIDPEAHENLPRQERMLADLTMRLEELSKRLEREAG